MKTTSDTHATQLVEGNFSVSDARMLLLELLTRKINYHELKQFSNEERFGTDKEYSAQRIKQLAAEKQRLINWLDSLDQKGILFIEGKIELKRAVKQNGKRGGEA